MNFTNLLQLEALAREVIDPAAFDFIAGGADDEISLHRNRDDFDRITLRPRYLIDVSTVDTSTTILGTSACPSCSPPPQPTSSAAPTVS
jgi:isopentenyl diphosphate isomerase/L-lactate dehydrogenase-like FMN-dependent dehydrogenase